MHRTSYNLICHFTFPPNFYVLSYFSHVRCKAAPQDQFWRFARACWCCALHVHQRICFHGFTGSWVPYWSWYAMGLCTSCTPDRWWCADCCKLQSGYRRMGSWSCSCIDCHWHASEADSWWSGFKPGDVLHERCVSLAPPVLLRCKMLSLRIVQRRWCSMLFWAEWWGLVRRLLREFLVHIKFSALHRMEC